MVAVEGIDKPQYTDDLVAMPYDEPPYDNPTPDFTIDSNIREAPFGEVTALDPVLNRAIWSIPDAGMWADIHRLRAADARSRELRCWEERIVHLEEFVFSE